MFLSQTKKNQNKRIRQPRLSSSSFSENGQSSMLARRHKPDYGLLLISIALLIIGLVVMYSISPGLAAAEGISQHYYIGKQAIAIGLGVIAFIVFSTISIGVVKRMKKPLIFVSLIMIIAVQFAGQHINGASRWIQIAGFSFQVAELIKFSLIIWLASFLVARLASGEIRSTSRTLKPLLYVMAGIGLIVAGLESDLGSAGVMVAILVVMAFSAGMPVQKLILIGLIIITGLILAISITPYRRDRLSTFLNPAQDCQAEGYQSCQALIAVGSGGMFGLGLANGVQAYGYLPEAQNDSIFAILGEKFGFIGTSIVIGIYALLFSRLRKIIICTADTFSRLFVIGVLTWLSVQTIINIGAMIGLLPLKGITLPLISYGGTSLFFVMAALGVVFQISRYTAYAPIRNVVSNESEGGGKNYDNTFGRGRQRRPHYASFSGR